MPHTAEDWILAFVLGIIFGVIILALAVAYGKTPLIVLAVAWVATAIAGLACEFRRWRSGP